MHSGVIASGEIFVVGSFVAGITIRVPRQPAAGETIMGDAFDMGPGGKGFNQAVAAKRAGAVVNMILCTGNDSFGDMAEQMLFTEQIPKSLLLKINGANTGCGMVTLLHSGENSIIINAGANNQLSSGMVREAAEYIANSKIVMAQLEVPDDAIETAFLLAKKNHCITILNPAPARTLSPAIIRNTDILTPNETEAKILLGLPPDADIPISSVAHQMRLLGFSTIVMTRGRHGALIITKDQMIEVEAPLISVIDPTGAGDCFNGNLAYAMAHGLSLEPAVTRAVYAGAFCAGHLGVIHGLPKKNELEEYMKVHNVK